MNTHTRLDILKSEETKLAKSLGEHQSSYSKLVEEMKTLRLLIDKEKSSLNSIREEIFSIEYSQKLANGEVTVCRPRTQPKVRDEHLERWRKSQKVRKAPKVRKSSRDPRLLALAQKLGISVDEIVKILTK